VNFLQLPHEKWTEFFDRMTKTIRGQLVEVEVAGLDLGDQIEAEWLPLNGVVYDAQADAVYVYTEASGGGVDHAISHPREVFAELGDSGVSQVVVLDGEGHKQFLRLRSPLELPAVTA